MSLLGGVLTYTAKTETDNCNATTQDDTQEVTINCTDTTTIQNLKFAGQHVTGTFTQPTTFNAASVAIQIPGYCAGVALFTGQLTVSGSSTQTSGDKTVIRLSPIALEGTLTCVGLPLASLAVDLDDEDSNSHSLTVAGAGGGSSAAIGMAVPADDGEDEGIEDY